MSPHVPAGFRVAGVRCGIKSDPQSLDLTLVACDEPAVAAGVYTQNIVCAAPVVLDRGRTPSDQIRVVVVNSGNANACTGSQGDKDAAQMARWAADAVGAEESTALVMSTGIIGEHLPIARIEAGIQAAASQLGQDDQRLMNAARGIMTTDTAPKLAAHQVEVPGGTVHITGIAKGSGMIGPNMATMLAVVMTDATLDPRACQDVLQAAVDRSFNCISVDGHTSTNDTVLLLASGAAAAEPLAGDALNLFRGAVVEVCEELARAIVTDGEGATHLIQIDVEGCATSGDASQIARSIASSPLVKTAIAGADPNWGRIVSAAGYAGVPFSPGGVSLRLNGVLLYEQGQPVRYDATAVSESIRTHRQTDIVLCLDEGDASARFWTCDLTAEYVRINADYHT